VASTDLTSSWRLFDVASASLDATAPGRGEKLGRLPPLRSNEPSLGGGVDHPACLMNARIPDTVAPDLESGDVVVLVEPR
jgi:hypothetical protein